MFTVAVKYPPRQAAAAILSLVTAPAAVHGAWERNSGRRATLLTTTRWKIKQHVHTMYWNHLTLTD